MAGDTEITKVRIVIRHLLWQIRDVRKDKDAAWQWVNRFADTLQYQDLEQDPDQYALAILSEARSFNDQKKRNQQMRWVREQLAKEGIDNPTQEQLDEKWLEMYGQENSPQDAPNGNAGVDVSDAGNGAASKSPTSCDQFTADGDIREDSQAKPDGSAITRNETRAHDALEPSANLYGNGGSGTSQARESRRTGTAVPELRRAAHSPAPVRSSGPMPANVQKVYDFASLEGLDKDDAYECWYVTTAERDGNDADGNPVTNWKAFVRTWCNTRSKKRSA